MKCRVCDSELMPGKIKCACGAYNPQAADGAEPGLGEDESVLLEDIVSSDVDRIESGHWDECFGYVQNEDGTILSKGMVRGSTNLIAGAPGAGKSTLFLGIAQAIVNVFPAGEVLYLASEEDLPQIRSRANRMHIDGRRRLRFLDLRKGVSDITPILKRYKFMLLILDSLAAISEEAEVQIQVCKAVKQYATFQHAPAIISHHVNKGEEIAGLMKLQHAVDMTSTFFGDPAVMVEDPITGMKEAIREFETRKNRNGPAWVRRYFAMTARGLMPTPDPYPDGKEEEEYIEEEEEEPESEANPRISKKGKKK
jgi:predicted ATP-dependent serine protease